MVKIKYLLFLLLLCSCSKKRPLPSSDTISLYVSEDTLTIDSVKEQSSIDVLTSAPIKTTTPSQTRYKPKDNMRGFDPASEDDSDDNGMTRYMEVNDDEGWD
jgi:hypothetical protein